jgi:peptide/nickel transport system permease protein
MARFAAVRAASAALTLLVMTALAFLVLQVLPGDPAILVLGMDADPAAVARLRAALGLDKPLALRYGLWLWGALHGNLGTSLQFSQPVTALILQRLPLTLTLAALAALLALVVALPIGMLAAVRRGGLLDLAGVALAQLGAAVPAFWLGIVILLAFAVRRRWFPAGRFPGWTHPLLALHALILPAVALGVARAAVLTRLLRQSVSEALRQDFVRTARAKGVSPQRVLWRHALRAAAVAPLTVFGLQVGELLAGSIVIESVFSLPGLGRLVLYAISMRDLPTLEGCVLVIATLVMLANFAVDLLYAVIDPRIRYEGAA